MNYKLSYCCASENIGKPAPSVDFAPLSRWSDKEWFDRSFDDAKCENRLGESYAYFAATEIFRIRNGLFRGGERSTRIAVAGPFSTEYEALQMSMRIWEPQQEDPDVKESPQPLGTKFESSCASSRPSPEL